MEPEGRSVGPQRPTVVSGRLCIDLYSLAEFLCDAGALSAGDALPLQFMQFHLSNLNSNSFLQLILTDFFAAPL